MAMELVSTFDHQEAGLNTETDLPGRNGIAGMGGPGLNKVAGARWCCLALTLLPASGCASSGPGQLPELNIAHVDI